MTTDHRAEPGAPHWDDVYRTRDVTEVSWFQAVPTMSLDLLHDACPMLRSVVDVGGGASLLVDSLLDEGVRDVTVVDASEVALAVVRDRLAPRAADVDLLVADVRSWVPDRTWEAWHDRAVFHFLVDRDDQVRYVTTTTAAVERGGVVVLGTFAPDGPERCSGLPTARHDADGLAQLFGPAFTLERAEREVHHTPSGADQAFTWVVLRRT